MKALKGILCLLAGAGLVVFTFFACFKTVVFNRSFINREMVKYDVASDTKMEEADLEALFDETLKYLEGRREDMVIDTVVGGVPREAFNEQEKLHMVDVKGLFDAGYTIYYCAIGCCVIALAALLLWKDERRGLAKGYCGAVIAAFIVFFVLAVGLGSLFATDFDRYFVLFHEIFFDNDLWLMDPKKCLMINMMPQNFFFDIVMKFGLMFLCAAFLVITLCVIVRRRLKAKLLAEEPAAAEIPEI